MNLDTLLNAFRDDNRLKELALRMGMPGPRLVSMEGLAGASAALAAGAVWSLLDDNHVFILRDREEAAYFQNDLENMLHALDIFYFPDSFKKAGFFDAVNGSHLMLRTEALMKFADPEARKKILVTYPEAVFEKVVPPAAFSSSMIRLKSGEELDTEALMARLTATGFQRVDFVYEPGQFAMRGGILDVYSFRNDKPYRVELFGEEIDSIRLFDPETQLSERKLVQVTLIPNMSLTREVGTRTSLFEFLATIRSGGWTTSSSSWTRCPSWKKSWDISWTRGVARSSSRPSRLRAARSAKSHSKREIFTPPARWRAGYRRKG